MEISAVKLRNSYQIYYVDTNNIFVNQNTDCIVDIEHGIDIGRVVKTRSYQNDPSITVSGKILRKVSDDDKKKLEELKDIEDRAFKVCREKSKAKNLAMKLVSVKCLFDKTKIIFYFVAENRIDFRELVRELAAVFRTRIEMRQIGVRDEARLVGGYGPCGKPMCCLYQRDEFEPVSIKMAKEQNLNLNSMKISGMCGRLLCCLGYEYDVYRELNETMPQLDTVVLAGERLYNVISVNTLKETVTIRDKDSYLEVKTSDLDMVENRYIIKDDVLREILKSDEDNNK